MTWRNSAKSIIGQVITDNPGADLKTMKRLLFDAYPYGPRKYHPYKIWCSQVNRTLKVLYSDEYKPRSAPQKDEGNIQLKLF